MSTAGGFALGRAGRYGRCFDRRCFLLETFPDLRISKIAQRFMRLGMPRIFKIVAIVIGLPVIVAMEGRVTMDVACIARIAAEPRLVTGLGHRAKPIPG